MNRVLKVFDEYLSKNTFFVGDSLTIFDISLGVHLDAIFRLILTETLQKKYKNVTRWFSFVRSLQPFKAKI